MKLMTTTPVIGPNKYCKDEKMNHWKKLLLVGSVSCLLLTGGCATGHIDPADRDTTGTYDGGWILSVSAPKADRVRMPGRMVMHCDWEPYEFRVNIKDGQVQLAGLEREAVVAANGKFRFDRSAGSVRMMNGVISGSDNKIVGIYSGDFSGAEPKGEFVQNIASLGGHACRANMILRRA